MVLTQEQYQPPFSSAGYKIYDLRLSPVYEKRVVGEKVALNCTAVTELNMALDFKWSLPQDKVRVWGLLLVEISKQCAYICITVYQSITTAHKSKSGYLILLA